MDARFAFAPSGMVRLCSMPVNSIVTVCVTWHDPLPATRQSVRRSVIVPAAAAPVVSASSKNSSSKKRLMILTP